MGRDTRHINGYLPLFAGSASRRQIDPLILLPNLPPPPEPPGFKWYDSFTGEDNMLEHVADFGTYDRKYNVSNSTMYVTGGRVTSPTPAQAVTREITSDNNGAWSCQVYAPPPGTTGLFRFGIQGQGFPWSGFDDPLVQAEFLSNGGMEIRWGRYNRESEYQFGAASDFSMGVTWDLAGNYADVSVLGWPIIRTSIPSTPLIQGYFVVQNCAMDEYVMV